MQERRRFKQIDPLGKRFSEEAERLRKEARGTPHGVERDRLIHRARQAEIGARVSEWFSSARPEGPDLKVRPPTG